MFLYWCWLVLRLKRVARNSAVDGELDRDVSLGFVKEERREKEFGCVGGQGTLSSPSKPMTADLQYNIRTALAEALGALKRIVSFAIYCMQLLCHGLPKENDKQRLNSSDVNVPLPGSLPESDSDEGFEILSLRRNSEVPRVRSRLGTTGLDRGPQRMRSRRDLGPGLDEDDRQLAHLVARWAQDFQRRGPRAGNARTPPGNV